jgi:hypothetical protein
MPSNYRLPDPLPWAALAPSLAAAEDSLARLDERLRGSPIREGWIARTHFADSCASLWLDGDMVPLEDREKLGRGINPKKYPDLVESYAFLRSAHQDSFDKAKIINDKYTTTEMALLLDVAMSSSPRRRNCALFVLGNAFGIPHAHIASYLMLSQSTLKRWTKESFKAAAVGRLYSAPCIPCKFK